MRSTRGEASNCSGADLEGQLSNPAKRLKSLVPPGLEERAGARQVPRTRQKQTPTGARSPACEALGHYSNPATDPADEDRSRRADPAPLPAAPHPTQGRLRAPDIDSLIDRYRTGDTINQLARRFAINRTTVIAHLDRRGVERRATSKQWDPQTLTSAARSYADGSSLADIAAQLGLDPSTVANRFRRVGIRIRPRQGWDYRTRNAVSEVLREIWHGLTAASKHPRDAYFLVAGS
jgi:DNA-binding CsgD family transcriptional regulator